MGLLERIRESRHLPDSAPLLEALGAAPGSGEVEVSIGGGILRVGSEEVPLRDALAALRGEDPPPPGRTVLIGDL